MAHLGQVFLVGGPVRDQLLGLQAHDNDWVVVGSTPDRMLKAGFTQVGKDFPVFLHPESKEEYALARTERKEGHGYQGFVCHTSPDVTLEEDLLRRDFTINAMALSEQQELVDPYNGQKDLTLKILRHVSPAFAEDPLRVLRGARFLSRFYHLGFSIAEETQQLMAQLTEQGELEHLSAERVWKETERALMEKNPEQYFFLLHHVNALKVWWIELEGQSLNLPKTFKHQPVALLRWGYLLRNLAPSEIKTLCERLRCPKRYQDFALLVQASLTTLLEPTTQTEKDCLALLEKSGVLKQGGLFHELLMLLPDTQYDLKQQWQTLAEQVAEVKAQDYLAQGLKGPALGQAMTQGRLQVIHIWLESLSLK